MVTHRLYINLQTPSYNNMKDMIESLHSYYDFVARKSLHLDTVIVFSMPDDPTPNNVAAEADDLDVIFNEEADEIDDIKQQRKTMGLGETAFETLETDADEEEDTDASESDSSLPPQKSMTRYNHVAVGGTFDHLHAGHKLLLSASVALTTDKLTIGLTDKSLCTQKKFVEFMQEYDDRAEAVARFVEMLNPNVDVKICPLMDPLGPAATDGSIEVLVVSQETSGGVAAANRARSKNNLSELIGVTVPLIDGGDKNAKLSSTMLRQQEKERQSRQ